jgi:hypothetical protein
MMRLAMIDLRRPATRANRQQQERKNCVFHTKNILAPVRGIGRAFISPFLSDLHNRNRREVR